jgi:hypothetical protein
MTAREIDITDATTEAEVALMLLWKSHANTTGSEINDSSQSSVADAPLHPDRDNSAAKAMAPPSSDDSDRVSIRKRPPPKQRKEPLKLQPLQLPSYPLLPTFKRPFLKEASGIKQWSSPHL